MQLPVDPEPTLNVVPIIHRPFVNLSVAAFVALRGTFQAKLQIPAPRDIHGVDGHGLGRVPSIVRVAELQAH